jgi:hypothetical protein
MPDVKSMQHRREINKKTKSADRKLIKTMRVAKKVRFPSVMTIPADTDARIHVETQGAGQRHQRQLPGAAAPERPSDVLGEAVRPARAVRQAVLARAQAAAHAAALTRDGRAPALRARLLLVRAEVPHAQAAAHPRNPRRAGAVCARTNSCASSRTSLCTPASAARSLRPA